MMRHLIALLAFALATSSLIAQKEANVWHFVYGYGLDFHSDQAVQITEAMSTIEVCAAHCDSAGSQLFYSNGGGRIIEVGQDPGTIWNKNNEVMSDLKRLEGSGYRSRQSSVIVPTL